MGGFFSGGGNSNNLIIKQLIFLMGVLKHPEHPPGYAPDRAVCMVAIIMNRVKDHLADPNTDVKKFCSSKLIVWPIHVPLLYRLSV